MKFYLPAFLVTLLSALPLAAQSPLFSGFEGGTTPSSTQSTRGLITCGDVNLDGIPDFAHRWTSVKWRVRSGLDGALLHTIGPDQPGSFQASTACGLPDVNGDGRDDVVICDKVVFELRSVATNAIIWSQPVTPGTYLTSWTMDRLGDVDGDGVDDFLTFPNVGESPGILLAALGAMPHSGLSQPVEVRSGATGALISSAPIPANAFIHSAANGGDVDADGDIDILVLAIGASTQSENLALAYDAATGTLISTIDPLNHSLHQFKGFVRGGADFDGDGHDDVIISFAKSQLSRGELVVHSGANGSELLRLTGDPCDGLGVHPVIGDFNDDDRIDIAVTQFNDAGNPNIGSVYSGHSGSILETSANDVTNCDAVILLDLNSDGYDDFIAGGTDPVTGAYEFVAIPGGPILGGAGEGNDGMGDDLLCVNDSPGDDRRCVEVDRGAPISFTMQQPGLNPVPADYAIFGCIGVPREDETFDGGPSVGDFSMIPAPALPWAVPALFTLATNIPGVAGTVFQTGPAPWTFDLPQGIDAELTFTLQGVVRESATEIRKTNGIIVRIR